MAEHSPNPAPPPVRTSNLADIRRITSLERFGTGPFPQQIDVFAGAMSPPAVRMVVSGDARAAIAPDHYLRRQLPPVSLYAVPDHTLGGAGLLLGPERILFDKNDCLSATVRARLEEKAASPEWLGALLNSDARVIRLATPCVVPFAPVPSYADFLLDVLPRLYLFTVLRALGRRFPMALSRETPEWMRRIAALYATEGETVWYDPAREVVRAPMFVVPALMHVDYYLHPAMHLVADDLLRRAGVFPTTRAGGARIYLSYRAYENGRLSRLENEEELAQILQQRGFRVLSPWRMTLSEQLAAYREAACIITEHSAAACNALFMPHGAKVAVIGHAETSVRRICALRSHLLGIIEPDGGMPSEAAVPYRITPERFRAFVTRLIEANADNEGGEQSREI